MRALSNLTRTVVALLAFALPLLALAPPIAAATHPGSDPSEITAVGTHVFFVATTAAHGRELWVTDGTKAGTHEVADINATPGVGSDPDQLTAMGTKVYFFADDGTGRALWKSDGSSIGTKRLGGAAGPGLTNVNGTLFFYVPGDSDYALWKSDGTVRGTRLVTTMASIREPVVGLGGFFYFFTETYLDEPDWRYEYSLWKSDGTSAGTSLVTQLPAPTDEEGSVVGYQPIEYEVVSSGNHIYFLMEDWAAPCRGPSDLWQSDGTAAGTHQVFDFNPSETVDFIDTGLTDLGGTLYFGADDEAGNNLVWKTNGTELGTRIVKRISPWRDCGSTAMTAVGSRLFFFADGGLWRTRGTASTTVQIYPIGLPGCDMYTNEPYCHLNGTPAAVGSRLFFPAGSAGKGIELWVSDGTTAGTHMVKNIGYGAIGSQPSNLASDGTRLFFSAFDTVHGRELWVSNGTAAGTHMVRDINQ